MTLRLLAAAVMVVLMVFGVWFSGMCVGVTDGDTILVMLYEAAMKVRLNGIDCPEFSQDFGTKAKQFTLGLAFGKDARLEWSKKDRYGRILGTFYAGEKNVCEALVASGMAWHYVKYSDGKRRSKLEAEARTAKAGVWSMPNPVPPWEFRKQKRNKG